jgi:hypothetical protein
VLDNLKDLLGQASSPGDMATILLAGTVGFVLDAGLNAVGFLSPGYTGITAATTALGLKKGWQATKAKRKQLAAAKHSARNAQSFLEYLEKGNHHSLAARIQEELELYDRGLIDNEGLQAVIVSVIEELRMELRARGPFEAEQTSQSSPGESAAQT